MKRTLYVQPSKMGRALAQARALKKRTLQNTIVEYYENFDLLECAHGVRPLACTVGAKTLESYAFSMNSK